MIEVLSKEATEESDKYTIENITGEEELVKRAGFALYSAYSYPGKTLILAGKGNNGADAVFLSILLKKDKKEVEIIAIGESKSPVLIKLLAEASLLGIKIDKFNSSIDFSNFQTIVDGIYGTGFKREVKGEVKEIIEKANLSKAYKIAVDINSGLDSNSGLTSLCFKSDLTVSIGFYKPGHFLGMAKDSIKSLVNKEIGIEIRQAPYYLFTSDDLDKVFVERKNYSHKGTYGYIGIMGGSINYSGAAKLASLSLSSLISGAGVVRVIVPDDIKEAVSSVLLEQTLFPFPSKDGYLIYDEETLKKATLNLSSLAFGMGIGESKDNEKILYYLLKNYKGSLLIDADGLNTLSKMDLHLLNESDADIILTPHVKEFSRLTKKTVEEILSNPIASCLDFIKTYHVTLLLKGTATIIAKGDKVIISPSGSVSLAKGGSGDVLSGVITGISGFKKDSLLSSASGAFLMGLAGEECEKKYGKYASLPRDTIEEVKNILKKY